MDSKVVSHSEYNILNLDNPEMYSGCIELYSASQQLLTLKFFSERDKLSALFMVQFAMVHYIDLPAIWLGAAIHTAPEPNCWDLLTQVLGPAVAKPDMSVKNEFLEEFRLFIIHVRQVNYRILASKTIELVAP